MHYLVYLDEFGHIGPYVGRNHSRYNDSPVFGLGGFIVPAQQVRELAIYFYRLKCRLLAWDLEHKNPDRLPPYQWEKKGSALYTAQNVAKYKNLRRATFCLLAQIRRYGGHVFYTGECKSPVLGGHDSATIYRRQLLQAIRKIDRYCVNCKSTYLLMLDHQEAGDVWREQNVEACTLAMFEDKSEKCRSMLEPPIQGESHLFQTMQCADWICGLVGRLAAYSVAPLEYPDWAVVSTYFQSRLESVSLPGCGLDIQTLAHGPLLGSHLNHDASAATHPASTQITESERHPQPA